MFVIGGGRSRVSPKFMTWNGTAVAQYDGARWKTGSIGVITSCGGIVKCAAGSVALGTANNATDRTNLSVSADGLTGWTALPIDPYAASGTTDSTYSHCSAIGTDGGNTIVIGWQKGYWAGAGTYTSTDRGATWTWTDLTSILQVTGGWAVINSIAYASGKFILASWCANHDGSAYGNAVAYSADGIHWTAIAGANSGLNACVTNGIFCDAGGCWVGGNGALHTATDPAGTWSTSTAPMPTYPGSWPAPLWITSPFIAYDQGYYVALCKSAPYRSSSLSGTWSTAGMPTTTAYGIAARPGMMMLYDGVLPKIWKSTDGGGTWTDSACPITPGAIAAI